MHRTNETATRWIRLRRGLTALLLVLMVVSTTVGQQGYRVSTRQPGYKTAAERKSEADAKSATRLGRFKQKLSEFPKFFQNKSTSAETRPVSPARSRPIRRKTTSTAKQSPFSALKQTVRKALPQKPKRRPPLKPATVAAEGTARASLPSRRHRPVVTSNAPSSIRPPKARRPQIVDRQSYFPPPIGFTQSERPSISGKARATKPSTAGSQFRLVNQSPKSTTTGKWPAFTRGDRNSERIDWASGEVDPPPLPAGEIGPNQTVPQRAPRTIDVPLTDPDLEGRMQISSQNGRISLMVREQPLEAVLDLIAQQLGLNIVTSSAAPTPVSATLSNVDLDDALNSLLSVAGYTWTRQRDIVVVSPVRPESGVAPSVQGLVVRVFPLNFVSAIDIQKIVIGLLSPAGHAFITEADPTNRRRTRDVLVVEDLPDYLRRVEEYVAQVDQPPRQVLIEAHVLRVDLRDDTRHGVDFNYVASLANTQITLRTQGFTNPAASPAFFLGIDGTDLDALVEAIKDTTDAKTLASPKVLAVNGQEARIQIGERFGYLVTTTTETSTLQNVDFLDVGVVMNVTPQISDDDQVLMTIRPEVSSGRINVLTGLPEEETTEIQSTVMLPDGHGIVIGGLIQETDADRQSKIPILGDLWLIGRLFQRKSLVRERSEIVIALVPRIVPYGGDYDLQAETEFTRATTRLLDGALWKTDRPWEPVMPDAVHNPRRVRVHRVLNVPHDFLEPTPKPIEYYFATQPELDSWIPPFISLEGDDVVRVEAMGSGEVVPLQP